MLKHFARIALVTMLAIQWSGCSTSTAFIDYHNIDSASGVKVAEGKINGNAVGEVKGDAGGEIWSDCTQKASDSVREMMYKAKASGANAIGNLRWFASGNSTASCKKGWGYFVIWPFVLTPLFMSTAVTGTMYKMNGKVASTSGMYMIPDTNEAQMELARSIVMAQ